MTVLVTGGAGYIGAHTVRALRAASRDVVVLDTLERGNRNAVIDAKLIVGDIADQKLVAKICRKYKVTKVVSVINGEDKIPRIISEALNFAYIPFCGNTWCVE